MVVEFALLYVSVSVFLCKTNGIRLTGDCLPMTGREGFGVGVEDNKTALVVGLILCIM